MALKDKLTRSRDSETVREVRARQREEFGGINWGSAFFGWLVTVGLAAILLGLLSAAGAAFGLSEVSDAEAEANAETIGIVGGILLILVLAAAYYCGGYVSGRMSRFDGGRQGLAVWAIGLAVTVVLAVFSALFGAEYNVLERLSLPRIPIDEGSLTLGAAIALVAAVVVTLLAAMGGGKAGERFHRRVDRVGIDGSDRVDASRTERFSRDNPNADRTYADDRDYAGDREPLDRPRS